MHYNPKPQHLFECTYPPPPDKILEYRHPVFPLTCLSNGVIIPDDKWKITGPDAGNHLVVTYMDRGRRNGEEMQDVFPGCSVYNSYASPQCRLRNRSCIAYECYHGISISSREKVGHWDCNPYNLSQENLFLWINVEHADPEIQAWAKRAKKFMKRTGEEIEVRIKKALAKGWDEEEYIKALDLPQKYKKAYKKNSEIEV